MSAGISSRALFFYLIFSAIGRPHVYWWGVDIAPHYSTIIKKDDVITPDCPVPYGVFYIFLKFIVKKEGIAKIPLAAAIAEK